MTFQSTFNCSTFALVILRLLLQHSHSSRLDFMYLIMKISHKCLLVFLIYLLFYYAFTVYMYNTVVLHYSFLLPTLSNFLQNLELCRMYGYSKCNSTQECIPTFWKCDNYIDCPDGEDEADCPCPDLNFQCAFYSGLADKCVFALSVCDGYNDCSDGSDEANCQCPDT